MSGVSQSNLSTAQLGDGELDLSSMGGAVGRRKWLVLGATLAALACAGAFVTLVKPRYTGEARVLVENQESYFTRPQAGPAGSSASDSPGIIDAEAVASQVQVIMSRDLAIQAIRNLGLKGNPEFDSSADGPGPLAFLGKLLGGGGSKASLNPEDRLLVAFFEHLYVFNVGKSRVIQIEFSSRDPALAARAANRIADLYISVQSTAKRESARSAAASLGELVEDLRSKVADAETKAETFRADAGLTMGANNIDMVGQQLADLNTQLTLGRAALAESQAKARSLRDMLKQGRLDEVSDVANNDLIRRLTEQRANLKSQIASESRTLLPGHPRIKELTAQLTELDSQERLAVERAARAMENDAKVAGARVENLRLAVEQQKKAVGGSSVDEARARELDREARLLKDQLEANVAKYQEAVARENSDATPSDARVISRAVEPDQPSFPKKTPILVFAGVAGLLLSLGGVIAAELMSGRAYAPARIEPPVPLTGEERAAGFDDAGVGGGLRMPSLNIAAGQARAAERGARMFVEPDRTSDAVVGLVARLAAAPAGEFAQRVLVTARARGPATHEVAMAIGRALARDRRAVLVDFDQAAGVDQGWPGFGDLQAGASTFEDAIHRDRKSRLHVLPAGRVAIDPLGERDLILDALSMTYEFVLLVAPPLRESDAALDLAPDADHAVLAGETGSEAPELAELLRAGAGDAVAVSLDEMEPGRSAA